MMFKFSFFILFFTAPLLAMDDGKQKPEATFKNVSFTGNFDAINIYQGTGPLAEDCIEKGSHYSGPIRIGQKPIVIKISPEDIISIQKKINDIEDKLNLPLGDQEKAMFEQELAQLESDKQNMLDEFYAR